jgi:hypothetical protein
MKKFSILTLSFFLLFPALSYATSGACSSHDGVNCSSAAPDGKVMCNDGWENSSVYFSDAAECSICTPPIKTNCSTEADYAALAEQLNASGSSRYTPVSSDGLLTACRSSITQYQAGNISYQQCLSKSQVIYTAPVQSVDATCKQQFGTYSVPSPTKTGYCVCESGYSFNSAKQCVQQVKFDIDALCKKDYGNNSSYNKESNKCECAEGYWADNDTNQCETPEVFCSVVPNSHPVTNGCACDDGFALVSGLCVQNRPEKYSTQTSAASASTTIVGTSKITPVSRAVKTPKHLQEFLSQPTKPSEQFIATSTSNPMQISTTSTQTKMPHRFWQTLISVFSKLNPLLWFR